MGRPGVDYSIVGCSGGYDLITAFCVVEHLLDSREIISNLGELLKSNGRLIVEVPSADDALFTLFDCDAFQRFTYWIQHLFLFNALILALLARQTGLRVISIQYYKRYSLVNHLYWLSLGKPGRHQHWAFLDTPQLSHTYAQSLSAIGRTDTLIAYFEISSQPRGILNKPS